MSRTLMPEEIRRSKSLGVRITPELYAWLKQEAARLSRELGVPVTMSAVAARVLSAAAYGNDA